MKRILNKKSVAVLVSVALLLCLAVGGTLALLIDKTDPITNIFNPSKVTTYVDETFDGTTKTNVRIQNTGNINANIRAAIVVTWKSEDGKIYGQKPVAGTDYTISINTDQQSDPVGSWAQKGDGFYYWSEPVAPDQFTGILITSCTANSTAPEGYFLNVEIIASGIQAEGIPEGSHPWGIQ